MHGRRTLLKFIFGGSNIDTQPPDNLYNEESFRQSRRNKVTIKSSPPILHPTLEHRPIAVNQDRRLLGIWPADLRNFPATLHHG